MTETTNLANEAAAVIDAARAAEHAIQHLCRTTLTRPNMTPAQVDIVLAHLADAAAALPQAARQLGDILEHAKTDYVLEMDNLTEINDPDLAIDTARLRLDGAGEAAIRLYRQLDAAHNGTAHIATVDREVRTKEAAVWDVAPRVHRSEDRQPPTASGGGAGPGFPR